jgi:short-subunit dehydrogenase
MSADPNAAPLAFITGASSGIGRAMAVALHRRGYRLALVARRGDEIEAWTREAGWDTSTYAVFVADVRDVAAITGAGRTCLQRLGLPDLVIANAGISIGIDSAVYEDLEVMRSVYETNNIGLAATFQPFIRPMVARGSGALVGIASVAGIRGLPGHGAYCSSKAAVISYCESLRSELRPSGVRVTTIAPGYIDTPLTRANRFPMPFLMAADAFAERAVETMLRGRSYRVIPWPMAIAAKLLRLLPNALFDRMLIGQPRKARRGE